MKEGKNLSEVAPQDILVEWETLTEFSFPGFILPPNKFGGYA
jgi:hypothetical protein